MRVVFESKDFPFKLSELMPGQRIKMELEFNVDLVQIDTQADYEDRIGGQVLGFQVKNVHGAGGLDPVVSHAERALKSMSMGVHG